MSGGGGFRKAPPSEVPQVSGLLGLKFGSVAEREYAEVHDFALTVLGKRGGIEVRILSEPPSIIVDR